MEKILTQEDRGLIMHKIKQIVSLVGSDESDPRNKALYGVETIVARLSEYWLVIEEGREQVREPGISEYERRTMGGTTLRYYKFRDIYLEDGDRPNGKWFNGESFVVPMDFLKWLDNTYKKCVKQETRRLTEESNRLKSEARLIEDTKLPGFKDVD